MLTVGNHFPAFNLKAVMGNQINTAFTEISQSSYPNKWLVIFFWPKDFTFVCPTELAAFGKLNEAFLERDAQLLGVSTDSEYVHLAWKQHRTELADLPFPLLSDIKCELSLSLGIIDKNEGVAQRATFIIDQQGIIRFCMVNDLNVGRNSQEVLRVLDALQTDELCPCNWQKGNATLVNITEA